MDPLNTELALGAELGKRGSQVGLADEISDDIRRVVESSINTLYQGLVHGHRQRTAGEEEERMFPLGLLQAGQVREHALGKGKIQLGSLAEINPHEVRRSGELLDGINFAGCDMPLWAGKGLRHRSGQSGATGRSISKFKMSHELRVTL